jgi:hypothetical protein
VKPRMGFVTEAEAGGSRVGWRWPGWHGWQDGRPMRGASRTAHPSLGFAALASLTLGRSDATEALLGGMVTLSVLLAVAMVARGAMGAAAMANHAGLQLVGGLRHGRRIYCQ